MSKFSADSAAGSAAGAGSPSTHKFLFNINSPSDNDSDSWSNFSFNVYSDSESDETLVASDSDSSNTFVASVSASSNPHDFQPDSASSNPYDLPHQHNLQPVSTADSLEHWEKFVCPCDNQNMRNALQQNMDVPSSESDFEDFGSVSSSSYTSSASLSDQPYEPHRGHYTHDYELTASESEKFPPSQSEESEEDDEESDTELQQGKKKSAKKSAVPLDTPLLVLKLPDWRENWTIQLGNSTMERVKNPMKLNFLQNFRRTLLVQSNVLFDNIPEFEDDYFGKFRVLIGQKWFENESTIVWYQVWLPGCVWNNIGPKKQ